MPHMSSIVPFNTLVLPIMTYFRGMEVRTKIIPLFLMLFAVSPFFQASAQTRVLDNNPASIKWSQINTPSFKIIFPKGLDDQAQRMANTLEHISAPVSKSLGNKKPKKLPIVLQNQNSISNGFVALGPRRSEFQTTPPQNYNFIGTNKWMDLLAVHEYRHVVQFSQSRTGWNKLFHFLFGQNTQAGMAFTAAPPWFWEGDATVTETVLTPSGRGRIPDFDRIFRTNLLEGKRFNYNKQHLRSFKDFVPNHYVLGYHMVTHVRRRTRNTEIMDEVSSDAWSWPFVPFTFSNALKRNTGQYLVPTYNSMMDELKSVWEKQLDDMPITEFERINSRESDVFTDYSFPQVLEDGSVIALKSGIADIEEFVKFNSDGSHARKFVPGVMNDGAMLSSTQFKVVWNEFEFDPRWRTKTYSVIKWYDFSTGEKRTITKKSRYASAAISPDGYQIATILTTTNSMNHVVLLDAYNGAEKKRFDNPENAQYGMPRWSQDGKSLVLLKTTEEGKSVVQIAVESGDETVLIRAAHENIGHPLLYDNILFYNSPYNGIDNIYARDLKTGITYQVTSSKYGAYNPAISPDGDWIYYNDHTVNGLDVVRVPFEPSVWMPIGEVEDRNARYFEPLIAQEGDPNILDDIPNNRYEVKNYSKFGHMINIHSWGPFASTDLVRAEAGIFSRDILSNTNLSLGYVYDIEEETGFASAALSYQAWYPIIDLEYQIGSRSTSSYKWDESTFLAGLRLPFVFTKSKYFTELEFSNSIGLRKVTDFRNRRGGDGRQINISPGFIPVDGMDTVFVDRFVVDQDELQNGDLLFNDLEISLFNLMKQSPRDINSRFGQFLIFKRLSTFSGDFQGATTGVRGGVFFPGLDAVLPNTFKNHSLFFRFGLQNRETGPETDIYAFRNVIFKPRGYSYPVEKEFVAIQSNYTLPLIYPDLSLGPFLNIKRVKANFFADYGQETTESFTFFAEDGSITVNGETFNFSRGDVFNSQTLENNYFSYGIELTFDVNIMRFTPNIEIGARLVNQRANDFNTGGTSVEIIFGGVNF